MAANGSAEGSKRTTSMVKEGDRAIVIARTFGAPPRIVFDAWTKPELVKQWWAPASHGVVMASCTADVRVGGKYRYVLRQGAKKEIAFSGTYTEVTPHSRLVYTQRFEPVPGGEVIVTVSFEERDGHTHVVAHELYPSAEVLETVLATGMEHGMRETMDQLDTLVSSQR